MNLAFNWGYGFDDVGRTWLKMFVLSGLRASSDLGKSTQVFADEIGNFFTSNSSLKITHNLLSHNDLRQAPPDCFATNPADGVLVTSDILPAENAFEKALFWPPTPRAVIFARAGAGAKSTFVNQKGCLR